MDVWFVRSPLPLVAAQREDVLLASHQNNAASGNIGVYSVRANDGTREFFEDCLDFQRRKPDEHDQRIFNNLLALSKYVAARRTRSTSACSGSRARSTRGQSARHRRACTQ